MSIAGISSTSAFNQPSIAAFQQRRNDFQELSSALQSGDLSSAQAAFNDLSNLSQSSSTGQAAPNSQIAQDFAAVGQALQSGDIAGAQQAFANFQQDVKSAFQNAQATTGQQAQTTQSTQSQPSVHHHHHHESNNSQSSTSNNDSISVTDANGDQVTINLGANNSSSGGPEQVTLNFGNSSGPQQVTLNLDGQSIVLNFGAGSSAASASTGGQLNTNA